MIMSTPQISSFLLIDGTLAGAVPGGPVLSGDGRPGWLHTLYPDEAAAVSPIVIDMDAAQIASQLDQMMALVNAVRPQLHVSIIDTALSHVQLIEHLRHFCSIRTELGKTFTLRFADCAVLPVLSTILNPKQWTAILGPVTRWCVHGRDGALLTLPLADAAIPPAPTPLLLTSQQLEELAEATAPDMLIAHIRDARHGDDLPGTVAEQHLWATEAHLAWRAAGNADDLVLRWLTAAALDTQGAVLRLRSLHALLAQPEQGAIRAGLLAEVVACQSKDPFL
ncbi:MAG: hypothetical protein JWR07_562 [Nevskia sp.]|nr:hypothetical protein [Nevskia sp.]